MTKYKDQRVCVLVDVQNMYHSARNLHNNARVDFKQVLETVTAGRKLIRAIAYVIRSSSTEESSFFEALEKSGFELKMKDLQVFMGGSKKADWDIGMAMDAVKMADKLDVVILVTGDGDFVPLVSYLRENKGCLIEVAAFRESTSSRLVEAADDFIDLSSDKSFLLRKRRE
jgi:uncharacterized LabA/DUF88 family protein